MLEKASIDEAFFDYTKVVKEVLLQRFPYLAQVPKDAEYGIDTPLPPPPQLNWEELRCGHVIPLQHLPPDEENKVESEQASGLGPPDGHESGEASDALAEGHGAVLNEKEQYTTSWHDIALSIAAELMEEARTRVREMGYTTSAVSAQLTSSYLFDLQLPCFRELQETNSSQRSVHPIFPD